jgi:hypothetical protein
MPNARLPKALMFSLTHGQAAWVWIGVEKWL